MTTEPPQPARPLDATQPIPAMEPGYRRPAPAGTTIAAAVVMVACGVVQLVFAVVVVGWGLFFALLFGTLDGLDGRFAGLGLIVAAVVLVILLILLVVSGFTIATAVGLLRRRLWARTTGYVFSSLFVGFGLLMLDSDPQTGRNAVAAGLVLAGVSVIVLLALPATTQDFRAVNPPRPTWR